VKSALVAMAAALLLQEKQEIAFKDVKDFCMQFDGVDLRVLGETKYDLVVIDHSRDHPNGSTYVPADYDGLRKGKGGPKVVFAHISVGVAQSSRFYWKKEWNTAPPAWLGTKDPDRTVSFHAKFWEPDFQALILGSKEAYIDRLIAAGFDGIAIDAVNAYRYWQTQGVQDAQAKMVAWVDAIGVYVRRQRASFKVLAIGGEELLSDGRFLEGINGLCCRSAYLSKGAKRPEEEFKKTEALLDRGIKEGKKLFILEYTEEQAEADFVHARAKEKGYVAYCGPSGLGKLSKLHEPE
jgi:cysteinyl-tRNA synthetase